MRALTAAETDLNTVRWWDGHHTLLCRVPH